MAGHLPERAVLEAERPASTISTPTGPDRSDTAQPSPRAGRAARRRVGRPLLTASVLLTGLGMVIFAAIAFVPDTVEQITGNAKIAVTKWASEVFEPDALPQIVLGPEGGTRELDRCDGRFIEMVSYRQDGVLPLYAAHNVCGGDIILGWDIGQLVRVEGSPTIYQVIEERHTPKGTGGELLRGMPGEFMLQTCYYGENRMRFLSLAPLPDENQRPDGQASAKPTGP